LAITAKLTGAVVEALADPAVRRRLDDLGQEIPPRDQQTPEVLFAHHKAEIPACTPAVIITGSPESIVDPNDANDQRALFNKIKTAPAAAFLPKEGWLARLISGTRSVPEPALKDMLAAYDAAKKKAEQITP
jgi:hypothetical protein